MHTWRYLRTYCTFSHVRNHSSVVSSHSGESEVPVVEVSDDYTAGRRTMSLKEFLQYMRMRKSQTERCANSLLYLKDWHFHQYAFYSYLFVACLTCNCTYYIKYGAFFNYCCFRVHESSYQGYSIPYLLDSDWINCEQFSIDCSTAEMNPFGGDYRFVYFGPKGSWFARTVDASFMLPFQCT